jgi:hypothetical protein
MAGAFHEMLFSDLDDPPLRRARDYAAKVPGAVAGRGGHAHTFPWSFDRDSLREGG